MTEPLRARLAAGGTAIGAWSLSSDPAVGVAFAVAGFDVVATDLQHGRLDEGSLVAFATGVEDAGAAPLARLRWNAPADVMRALDLGVRGVISPMVGSADEAAALVAACRYPPLGNRSYGPVSGAYGAGASHVARANDRVMVFAMIETAPGLSNLDAIAATQGLDGLYVGPADLSLSLGLETFADLRDPRLLEALHAVVRAAERHGIVAGVHAPSPERSIEMLERGFRFVTPVVDDDVLASDAAAVVERMRAFGR